MATITLHTIIDAPIDRCFKLSLSIDLHQESVSNTHEMAIAGITKGIIKLNETVTWKAKHFGFYFKMTSKITELVYPTYFVDEMLHGPFKKIRHQHYFMNENGNTQMIDVFDFEAPFGFIGKMDENLILIKYLKQLLIKRNHYIKKIAEGNQWNKFIK